MNHEHAARNAVRSTAPAEDGKPIRSLRVGSILGATGFGGSQNSCAAISEALADRGHDVTLFCQRASARFIARPENVRMADLPPCAILPAERGNIRGINLLRLVAAHTQRPFDAMIVFNPITLTLAQAFRVMTGVPVVLFLLGSDEGERYFGPFDGPIVANSPDARQYVAEHSDHDPETVPIVEARFSVRGLERAAREPCPLLDQIPDGVKRIAVAARFNEPLKTDMIIHAIKAADVLAGRRRDFCLVIAGDGKGRSAVAAEASSTNARHKWPVAKLIGYVDNVGALFARADVVIGQSRGLVEAMSLGKPCVNVGQRGLAGVIKPETVDQLAWNNFSGTHIASSVPPERLAAELDRLLSDKAYADRLGQFARQCVRDRFDAHIGAAQIEEVILAEVEKGGLPWWRRPGQIPSLAKMGLAAARSAASRVWGG